MCIICIEWEKGKMTNNEAKRALHEMVTDDVEKNKHLQDVWYKIEENELNEGSD